MTIVEIKQRQMNRWLAGAKAYAAADRSDPFTMDRCLSHIRSGIVGQTEDGEPAEYTATPFLEERSYGEVKYNVTRYKNIQRP
jgi:hypothetical protein